MKSLQLMKCLQLMHNRHSVSAQLKDCPFVLRRKFWRQLIFFLPKAAQRMPRKLSKISAQYAQGFGGHYRKLIGGCITPPPPPPSWARVNHGATFRMAMPFSSAYKTCIMYENSKFMNMSKSNVPSADMLSTQQTQLVFNFWDVVGFERCKQNSEGLNMPE